MHLSITPRHAWCTASHNDVTKSSLTDLLMLGDHLVTCPQVHRHLMALRGAAAVTHGFVVSRFVTTLVALAALCGLAYWLL